MPKGPRIKDWIKWYIRTEALMNRAEPRDAVAQRIEGYLEDKEQVPSRDTLNKMISKARNSPDLEDNPWSVLSLADYDIPPGALPVVMQAWAKALEQDKPFTIRQAKWIARLYCILGNTGDLIVRASEYASREKAIKLTGPYPDKPKNMRWLWIEDAALYRDMTGDVSLLETALKWETKEDIETRNLELLRQLKEAQNERTHSTEGQP